MARRAVFNPYRPKTVLNKGRRANDWFWTRYSAYPYIGCQHGCEFCYCREQKYSPYADPLDFAFTIKVKENAAELLRKGLSRLPVDGVFTGDYQPAERKFQVSRRMLEVCRDLDFPVFILERSPLVLRDLDLIEEIRERAWAVVAFSTITAPGSPTYEQGKQMEHLAPAAEKRFAAMEKLAAAGILTGVCFMPILPGLCDTEENLEAVVRCTAEHGGSFVLAGGLTLADQQRQYFFKVLGERFPEWRPLYEKLYPPGSYGAAGKGWLKTARRVRELCARHGINDRIPRPIIPGDKHALNRRIGEKLANQLYTLELEEAPAGRIWMYRKAAWALEDLEQDVALIYRTMGRKGLESLPGLGPLAGDVEALILRPQPW